MFGEEKLRIQLECIRFNIIAMAQCKQTPQEFIKSTFTPQIGVIWSSLVEQTCQKNNLSFIDLYQPFSKLGSDVHYKDPNGTVITIKNLKLTFSDVNAKPPQPILARKYLNSAVINAHEPRPQTLRVGEYTLDIPSSTPWFEAWRETFLQVQFPSDHEFTKHFLACILAVSSADSNPLESLNQMVHNLDQMQFASTKMPKWFNSNFLRYYVIVHDNVDADENNAIKSLEAVKAHYGTENCFLLKMNSRPLGYIGEQLPDPWSQFISNQIDPGLENKLTDETPLSATQGSNLEIGQEASEYESTCLYHPLSPDVDDNFYNNVTEKNGTFKKPNTRTFHGSCLSTNDVEEIKLFIHEFCTTALLPYVEQEIQHLSDAVSTKKGVSRSLFSATKRWFSPNKPGTSTPVNNIVYSPDSPELQMRKLGDLYFMFGHYAMAYQAYHSAKRDFNADQAWLHYAGALEMAALAAFMASESNRKTFDYMEESITTYLNISNKLVHFATRATLLSVECLKEKNLYGEAAHQLIRMTSEESDLRSALLLEQAGYCFLHSKPSMVRKYAFHMVLAGHRFSKAAQQKHSLRSYKQAYQVYNSKGWNLAEDHIHYAVGKLANNLSQFNEAVQSFTKLLYGQSRQTAQQQTLFLKEYLTIYSMLQKSDDCKEIGLLHLPVLVNESIRILVGPPSPLTTPGKIPATGVSLVNQEDSASLQKWNKLEEMLVQEVQGSLPLSFKPAVTLYTADNFGSLSLTAVTNEPIQVSLKLGNPLQIPLNLSAIYLLWDFQMKSQQVSNIDDDCDTDACIKTHCLKSVVLQASCCQELTLTVTPLVVGRLILKGICYNLINPTNQDAVKGKQLFSINTLNKVTKQETKQLEIILVPPAPCLQVTFSNINSEVLCNEIQKVTVELHNTGTIPVHNIHLATSVPELLSTCEFVSDTSSHDKTDVDELTIVKEKHRRRNHVIPLLQPNDRFDPGRSCAFNLWLKAPDHKCPAVIDLLIYYENIDSKCIPRYRLVRHVWRLSVQQSVNIESVYQQSLNSEAVENIIFSIKITNLNKIHHTILTEILLLKIALLSTYWILSSEVIAPKNIVLHSQETVHIMLKGTRKTQSKEKAYTEITLTPDQALSSSATHAYMNFAEKSIMTRMNVFNDIAVAADQRSEIDEGVLFLIWQAHVVDAGNKKNVTGQSHVKIQRLNLQDIPKTNYNGPVVFNEDPVQVRKEAIEVNEKITLAKLQKQIICSLKHPSILCHSFEKSRFCIVSVRLVLRSTSDTHSLSVTVNMLDTNSLTSSPSLLYNPYSSKCFRWVRTGRIIKIVKPFCSETIELSAAVFSPGTYDLGAQLEIQCNRVDEPNTVILQTCRINSALIVVNSKS